MDTKGIVAIAGFSSALVCAMCTVFSWIRGIQAGSRMQEYLRVNHPDRWAQLESANWFTRMNDHTFYNLGADNEGDPTFEPLKRNYQQWYGRMLCFIGAFAACVFTTFVIELVIQAK